MEKSRKPPPPSAPRSRARKKAAAPAIPDLGSPAVHLPADQGWAFEPRYTSLLSAEHPLLLCAVNSGHATDGLALLLVARRIARHAVCAHFVVDLVASGVTECYGEAFTPEDLAGYVEDMDGRVPL